LWCWSFRLSSAEILFYPLFIELLTLKSALPLSRAGDSCRFSHNRELYSLFPPPLCNFYPFKIVFPVPLVHAVVMALQVGYSSRKVAKLVLGPYSYFSYLTFPPIHPVLACSGSTSTPLRRAVLHFFSKLKKAAVVAGKYFGFLESCFFLVLLTDLIQTVPACFVSLSS